MVIYFGLLHFRVLEKSEPMKSQGVIQVFLFNHEDESVSQNPPSGKEEALNKKPFKTEMKTPVSKKAKEKQKEPEAPKNEAKESFEEPFPQKEGNAEPLDQKIIETDLAIPVEYPNRFQVLKQPAHFHLSEEVWKSEGGVGNEKNRDWKKDYLIKYKEQIVRRIMETKKYPPLARKKRIEGRVSLDFTIGAEGDVDRIKIFQSSHQKILDEEAIDTIRRSSPLPPIPEVLGLTTVKVRIPLSFNLTDE